MRILIPILLSMTNSAFAFEPKCINVGTRSEGWSNPNGQVKFDQCADKVAVCAARGSKSEGWYAFSIASQHLIAFAGCDSGSDDGTILVFKPECINIGTRSEGWSTPSGQVKFDQCAKKVAACREGGSRSEGWYALVLAEDRGQLIAWANCAK